MTERILNIACFISPHGFGHAARMCALIESLKHVCPTLKFHICTTVPKWFFDESLSFKYDYHKIQTDVGLVQIDPINIDHQLSIAELKSFYPLKDVQVHNASTLLKRINASMCLCDISPLGIQAARNTNIPAVLLKNFTWDWIYKQLGEYHTEYLPIAQAIENLFQPAVHIRLRPECPTTHPYDSIIGPIARNPTMDRIAIRNRLNVPVDKPLVFIAFGGVEHDASLQLDKLDSTFHVVMYSNNLAKYEGMNLTCLTRQSGIRSQDLLAASDLVIGKPGYSTVSEVVTNGIPFMYIPRPGFPESSYLEEYVQKYVSVKRITHLELMHGDWISSVPDLLHMECRSPVKPQNDLLAETVLHQITNLL